MTLWTKALSTLKISILTQHNDTFHNATPGNDTQHNKVIPSTQENILLLYCVIIPVAIILSIVILGVVMLSGLMHEILMSLPFMLYFGQLLFC